jgi:hypothetical protein
MRGDFHQSLGSPAIPKRGKGKLVLGPLGRRRQVEAHKPTGEEPMRRAAATPVRPLNPHSENYLKHKKDVGNDKG